jgi:hypothetical protein
MTLLAVAIALIVNPAFQAGKIALVDSDNGRVAIDLRARDGVMAGDKLEVTRDGRALGRLVILEVEKWGSWAKPDEETLLRDLHRGDRVETIIEKDSIEDPSVRQREGDYCTCTDIWRITGRLP